MNEFDQDVTAVLRAHQNFLQAHQDWLELLQQQVIALEKRLAAQPEAKPTAPVEAE